MNDESIGVEEPEVYHVSASKSSYVSESYNTLEEALAALNQFATDGYERVSLSKGSDIW